MTANPWLEIREVTAGDLEAVAGIERHCFGHAWTSQQYRDGVLEARCVRGLVAVIDERPVAFASLTCLAGQGYIPTFGVLEPYRRMGIGRRLLAELLAAARAMGAREVILEVRVSNAAAQQLYAAAGFTVLGIRRAYYQDPDEDGLVMCCAMKETSAG